MNLSFKRLLGRVRSRERPAMLSVEPTNRCNLHCPFCLVGMQNNSAGVDHDQMPRAPGHLSVDLFRKILNDARGFGIRVIQLHFQGEPLLHARFVEMVDDASHAGFETQVFTNGMLLTEDLGRGIIAAGIKRIRFSVDGASQRVYGQNRVGGDLTRVVRNMAMMVRLAREAKSGVRVAWQFIVMQNNEHELETARRMAQEIGIEFIVKTFAVTDPALVPRDLRYVRQMALKPCTDIYRAAFVYWNGDVVTCCYDQRGDNVVGNLSRRSLTDLWEGRAWRELRGRIERSVEDPSREPEMCRSCLKWSHFPWRTSDGRTVYGPSGVPAVDAEGAELSE